MKLRKTIGLYTLIFMLLQWFAIFGHSLYVEDIDAVARGLPPGIFSSWVVVSGWLWFFVAQVICYTFLGLTV
jgi:hypothetical protein